MKNSWLAPLLLALTAFSLPGFAEPPSTATSSRDAFVSELAAAIATGIGSQLRYPPASQKAGEEGEARVAIEMDRAGNIVSATINKSSGFAALDAEAVAVFQRLGHLLPMPDSFSPGSRSVALVQPVSFTLQAASTGPQLIDGQPGPDFAAGTIERPVAAPPKSPWLLARTRRFAALFKNSTCDILVVPVQTEFYSFDRATRAIMSADLARALAGSGSCVVDPYLADLALGEGLRRYSPDEVSALAASVKATTVVTAYAGHFGNGMLRVTLQVKHPSPPGSTASPSPADAAHSFVDCTFSNDRPPFLCFREQLPQMLGALGLKAAASGRYKPGMWPTGLPPLAKYIEPEAKTTLANAADLLFLAMLAPASESRTAERLFTKAWIGLAEAPEDDPQAQRMRARIMLHLYERPYALRLIAADTSPSAQALRAVLNGNLPEARKGLKKAKGDWDTAFLGFEVHDLEQRYGREGDASKQGLLDQFAGSPWLELVTARIGDRDSWGIVDTLTLKKILDQFYPVAGFDTSGAAIGSLLVGGANPAEFQLLALRHLHRLIEQQPKIFCCLGYTSAVGRFDLIDLLDGRIERALSGHAEYQISPQGKYTAALTILEAYDAELAGNPYHEAQRADANWQLVQAGQLQDRELRLSRMHNAAHLSAAWTQGQTFESNQMLWYLSKEPRDPATASLLAYDYDYPPRPHWSNRANSAAARLPFSADSAWLLSDLVNEGKNSAEVLDELKFRFVGSQPADKFRAKYLGEQQKTPTYYLEAISKDPDNWELRTTLAELLIKRKDYAGIAPVILGFPGYDGTPTHNSVNLSNKAYYWGNELFWQGAFEAAQPLLKRAAGYDNGAASSSTARARLALIDKDYGSAAASYLATAKHYDDDRRYDDFLRLMFVSGHKPEAWAVFDQVLSRLRAYPVWTAAMTGNRHAGLGDTQVREWLAAHAAQASIRDYRDDLSRYALMEFLTDRVLEADLPSFMRDFCGRADIKIDAYGAVSDRIPRDSSKPRIGPGRIGVEPRPPLPAPAAFPNRYALLAEAFGYFRAGQYAEAAAAFDRISKYYDLESEELMFTLPYFAFATASSGDRYGLEKYLTTITGEAESFGVQLARAVFASFANQLPARTTALDAAYRAWPTAYRSSDLQTSFVFLEITTLLYEKNHDPALQAEALRLARSLRVIEPTDAYAPALISYLSEDRQERVEALAVALFLDPRSAWANKATQDLRDEALTWGKQHPPFVFGPVERGI